MTYRPPRHKLISLCSAAVFVLGCKEEASRPSPGPSRAHGIGKSPRGQTETKQPTPAIGELRTKGHKEAPRGRCPEGVVPREGARISTDHLREISGIVGSRDSPGLFWVHNDSGDASRTYALESDATLLGTVELAGQAYDFEDIALEERDGAADRIYVADTGDNLAQRSDGVLIHRFEEPTRDELRKAGRVPVQATTAETMRLHFPEGPRDAEALLVDSSSGEIVLITKPHMARPEIYGISAFSAEGTLTRQGVISKQTSGYDLHMVTAADMSADNRWILLRSYTDILAFPRASGQSISSALLGKACRIEPAYELQGEAIAFLGGQELGETGSESAPLPQFVTVGEGVDQPLHFYGFVEKKTEVSPSRSTK